MHEDAEQIGVWARERLAERLAEKHSRAVFITAESRRASANTQYKYTELVYCERPDIQKFIDMVDLRRVVFEFTMTERPPGRVRNHGYPWRLVDPRRSEEHTSDLQSLMRISYAVFCLKKKTNDHKHL